MDKWSDVQYRPFSDTDIINNNMADLFDLF